jgi:HPt (histidine-containing phosphotransfer) domain-containing protein
VIDREVIGSLLDAVDGDREFLVDLIETWLDDAPRQLAYIEAAAAAGDSADLVPPAHTLKSTSASLGATEVAELARVLEHQARMGAPADAEVVARLRSSIAHASDGLRAIAAETAEDATG